MSGPGRDRLFDDPRTPVRPFVFDAEVARVFPDMVRRSVPGYGEMLGLIGLIARRFAPPDGLCYDLGCSLGAVTLSILDQTPPGVRVVAVDDALAMVAGLCERLGALPGGPAQAGRVEAVRADVREVAIENAALVVLNLTLQFVPPADRVGLIGRIRTGLRPGGALVLVEKTAPPEGPAGALITALHEDFKRAQGYSELAIARKRAALEQVLVPDPIDVHESRLAEAGFAGWTRWYQALGFVAWLAWT